MCMTDDPPVQYSNDVRDDLDELERAHGLEATHRDDGSRLLTNGDVLIDARDVRLDAGDGRVVCEARVETPCFKVVMLASEISVFGIGFEITSHHDPDEKLRVHYMEWSG